jgi:hypothetical protein
MDHEVVSAHGVPQVSGQPLELFLQALVLERRDPSAAVADGVVVVLTTGHHRLETRAAAPELHSLHQPHVVQEIEGPVNAGDAGVASGPAQALVDLLGGEAAVLARQQSDDSVPCATRAVPCLDQRRAR